MYYLSDAASIILIFAALVLWSWAVGSQRCSTLENTVIGVGFALGAAGTLIALFGSLGHFGLGFASLLWVPLAWLSRSQSRSFPAIKSRASHALRGLRGLRSVDLWLFVFLLLACALTLCLSLAPPNANDYDSLVYHLAAPQRYIDTGRVIELPYDHHSYFPFLTEMLFALGLAWKGPVLAKLFHWLMLPLCCATLTAIGQRHFSLRAGLLAAALFASLPIVLIEATTAYVDLSLCAFILLAFMCFLNWQRQRDNFWLLWSGVFCGFALGVKYSGAIFFLWLLAWASTLLLNQIRATGRRPKLLGFKASAKSYVKYWRPLISFVFLALLIGGGWYLRNFLWTGNPVYPFAYGIFGGKGWTLEMAKAYSQDQSAFGFGRGLIDFLLAPWRVAMAPLNFGQPFWPVYNTPVVNNSVGRFEVPGHVLQTFIGPTLLAFGLPLIFIRRKPAAVGFLLWTFAAMWVFWFLTSQQLRYLLPSLALLCVCCGWFIDRLGTRSKFLVWISRIALSAWLMFASIHTIWRMREVLPLVAGFDQPEYFLTRTFAGYDAMKWASINAPGNSVFAVYGEPRCFYLRRPYFWADDAHNNLIDYSAIRSDQQLVESLQKRGATNIVLNTEPQRNGGFGGAPPFLDEAERNGLINVLYEARGYRVYQITGSQKSP
jgi:hypothetical protein